MIEELKKYCATCRWFVHLKIPGFPNAYRDAAGRPVIRCRMHPHIVELKLTDLCREFMERP